MKRAITWLIAKWRRLTLSLLYAELLSAGWTPGDEFEYREACARYRRGGVG